MLKQRITAAAALFTAIVFLSCSSGGGRSYPKQSGLTLMVYSDADNNLEANLLYDIYEMSRGIIDDSGVNIIVLIDRISGNSNDTSVFGEDFTDTRLYRVVSGSTIRISGGSAFPEITDSSNYEANMGNALTLKKFVAFCKSEFPASRYALILSNHGGGSRGPSVPSELPPKAVCYDETSDKDALYIAEISDVLTASESVDLIAFDACIMGGIENAYQYRPGNGGFSASAMAASPPNVWGAGFDYESILRRINLNGGNNGEPDFTGGGLELNYSPSTVTGIELGKIIVEEQYDSTSGQSDQAMSCYDLSKAEAVKTAVDSLADKLESEGEKDDFEDVRDTAIFYFNKLDEDEWVSWPYFDLYDLAARVNASLNFSANVKGSASTVMTAVDDLIVTSFAGTDYAGFQNDKCGIYIFFPDGDRDYLTTSNPMWDYQWWYTPLDTQTELGNDFLYGKLAWCGGGTQNNGVENWFEMLDKWFDDGGDPNNYTP